MKQNAAARHAVVALTLLTLAVEVPVRAVASSVRASQRTQDKTITKVVKLLQEMLDTSKKEGDEERLIYGKFKCYCDSSDKEKSDAIEESDKVISLLESKIEELQGSSGEASSKSGKLKADMDENKQQQKTAEEIYQKEMKTADDTIADLTQGIGQMKSAISTLNEVGADQTSAESADHKQFMAGKFLQTTRVQDAQESVRKAVKLAEAFANEHQQSAFGSFLQAPFTGTYSSQAGPVMGILKSMKDTFEANLKDTIKNQIKTTKAHKAFMDEKKEAFEKMSGLYEEAQGTLGENDADLSEKKKQLTEAKTKKASDEEFLEKLRPMCEDKAESYEKRKEMRANEEVALSEAISILNSDAAFSTFDTVDATSFVQVGAVRRHLPGFAGGEEAVRAKMEEILRKASGGRRSPRLSHVVSLLHTKKNPFDSVLAEIDAMLDNIVAEAKADKEKKEFCESERKENKQSLAEKKKEILMLEGKIDGLVKDIDDPVTGLKADIAGLEDSLKANYESQKTETKERTEANVAYQADVKNLVKAAETIDSAIKVLKKYYDNMGKSFVQEERSTEDPSAPSTWGEDSYEGQSGEGNNAIKMLEFILKETKAEETTAHSEEESAQHKYEDSMTALKKEQKTMQESLVKTKDALAVAEKDLLDAKEDLAATTEDKESIEAYLEKIKPGCDFIQDNFDLRESNRKTESEALEKGKTLLKDTPAYKSAMLAKHQDSLGSCKGICNSEGEGHAKCKACLADVTVPAYCAGHDGTPGC